MNKLKVWALATSLAAATAIGAVGIATNGGKVVFADPESTTIVCPNGYQTDVDNNISRKEIADLPSYNEANIKACSPIIDSVSYEGYCARDTTYHSLRIGSSAKGSITFTLTTPIAAIGFYCCAYQNNKDTGKSLLINGVELTKTLPACQQYEFIDALRFFYELPAATKSVTISAKQATNNRFHLYSVGFYTQN